MIIIILIYLIIKKKKDKVKKVKLINPKMNESLSEIINITNEIYNNIKENKNNNININNILNYEIKENINIYNISKKLNDKLFTKKELEYDSLFNAAERAKDFINKSIEGILFNISFNLSNNPKISVVIPAYNCEKTIKRAVSSIQNQNFSDFEIIIVNDLSTDNTSYIIENLKKKDQRIKIINNQKNMGTLYTRCIGTLSSKGKYIFPLDNDDMLLDKDVFYKIVIEIAEKNDFDIIEFRAIESKGIKNFFKNNFFLAMLNKHKKGRVLYQPELSYYPLRPDGKLFNYHMSDVYIWGKCINSEIYKKAIILYGENRYSNYVTTFEDLIMNFIIFQFAKSFYYIPKYGILRIFSRTSAYLHTSVNNYNKYEMRLLDAVIDFSKNNFEGKKIVVNIAIKILGNHGLGITIQKEKYKKLLKSILERIFKCDYISEEHKQIIIEKSKQFNLFK